MPAARVLAQAKINLILRVLAREASGYHQIETVFCRLALGDAVTVRATGGPRTLDCTGTTIPGPAEENLAWRAASAYARQAHWPAGFAIEIEKRIPIGGGLGGGSADAGAVLRALNTLNPAPLPATALLGLAASLGADVPFLTQDESPLALGWGRGERLLALPPLPPRVCRLFIPGTPVATRDAYQWIDERTPAHGAALLSAGDLASWTSVAAHAHNDFEEVTGERLPAIASALAALRAPAARRLVGGNPIIQMSGSGSSLFVIEDPAEDMRQRREWRSDEPGFTVVPTTTSSTVEPVVIGD